MLLHVHSLSLCSSGDSPPRRSTQHVEKLSCLKLEELRGQNMMTKVGCASKASFRIWTCCFAASVLLVSTSGILAQDSGDDVQPESCVICHSGAGEKNHQAVYDQYTDASAFAVTIDSVVSVPNADPTKFDTTMTFTIKQNGAPYIDVAGLPSLSQKTFYAVQYDSSKRQFINSKSFSASTATPTATPGQYTVSATGLAFAPRPPMQTCICILPGTSSWLSPLVVVTSYMTTC